MTRYQELLVAHSPQPIRSEREYRHALRQVEALMTPRPTKYESKLIELLSLLIEQYEEALHPTPTVSPRALLAHFIENRGLTNAEVARATDVPRSTITNVLAGRRSISKRVALRLADYFRVEPGVFLAAD